ncbi:MAG TPA: DUF2510 domain-containing protein [Nocardioides sp.]|nr:DUF2510 domain-containing protein [Nocardioides sp.]
MSDPNQPSTPPGWYPDGQGGQRWWDGTQWTEHTQPAEGQRPAAPEQPHVPGPEAPTQIAPNRAADYPPQQQPQQQPAQPQQPYGAQPQQQPYGAPQYGGQQPYGAAPQYGAPPQKSGGKKGLLIGIIVAVVLVLLVCGVGGFFILKGGDDPKSVAKDYLGAEADGDFEKVCELTSSDYQKQLLDSAGADKCSEIEDKLNEQLSAFSEGTTYSELFDDLDINYDVGDVSEKGDKATVDYTIEVKYNGDNPIGQQLETDKSDETLELVKEDGDWKVDSDSSDME